MGKLPMVLSSGACFVGQFFHQVRPEGLRQEVENIAVFWPRGPASIALEDRCQLILAVNLLDKGFELAGVLRRKAAKRQPLQPFIGDPLAIGVQRITEHMPGARRRKRLLVLGGLAPEVIWPRLDVFNNERMNVVVIGPLQPIPMGDFQMDMHHAVEQGRTHGFDEATRTTPPFCIHILRRRT